jgi:hypothetical protein
LSGEGGEPDPFAQCKRCPEIEYAPLTPEGRAVLQAIERVGVWKRVGMSAVVAGLDMAEAMASLPDGADREFAMRLFVIAEAAYVGAWHAAQPKQKNE